MFARAGTRFESHLGHSVSAGQRLFVFLLLTKLDMDKAKGLTAAPTGAVPEPAVADEGLHLLYGNCCARHSGQQRRVAHCRGLGATSVTLGLRLVQYGDVKGKSTPILTAPRLYLASGWGVLHPDNRERASGSPLQSHGQQITSVPESHRLGPHGSMPGLLETMNLCLVSRARELYWA